MQTCALPGLGRWKSGDSYTGKPEPRLTETLDMVRQEVMALTLMRITTGTELLAMRATEVTTDLELEPLQGPMVAPQRLLDQVVGVAVGQANAAVLIQVKEA